MNHIKIYENYNKIICDGIFGIAKKGQYARNEEEMDETINEIMKITTDKEEAATAIKMLIKENPKRCDKENNIKNELPVGEK